MREMNEATLYKTTFEKAGVAIAHVSADGHWISVNEELCNFLGYTKDELLLKTFQEITYYEDLENDLDKAAKLYSGQSGSFTIDKRYLHKNGTPIWANLTATAIRGKDGNIEYFIAVIKDILAEKNLLESQKSFRTLLEISPIAVRIANLNGSNVVFANKAYARIIESDISNVLSKNPRDYYSDPSVYDEVVQKIDARETIYDKLIELSINGKKVWTLSSYMHIEFEGQNCVLGWFYDITEQINAKQFIEKIGANLKRDQIFLKTLLDSIPVPVFYKGIDGKYLGLNELYKKLLGLEDVDVIGKTVFDFAPYEIARKYEQKDKELLANPDEIQIYEYVAVSKDNGKKYNVIIYKKVFYDENGNIAGIIGSALDITDMKNYERKLEYIAHYDTLTGLPNRVLKSDRLRQSMLHVDRKGGKLAVVYLDLDGFKEVNDTFGHDIGDQLLVSVSSKMKKVLRESDTLSRLGGDEFVAIITDIAECSDALIVIERLLEAASEPVVIENKTIAVSASIGITFYPQADGVDGDQLIRQADQAMYEAKQSGKNRYHIFDSENDKNIRTHHEHLERIRQALQDNEFELYYQPKVNMRSGDIIGSEALIRWNHPEKGVVPPLEFLPLIEENKLAIDLGEWVINSALGQIQQWREQGVALHVSVNIGAQQLLQGDFIERLKLILTQYPDDVIALLEMEILETSALEDVVEAANIVDECKEMGINFSLDDFGTGYSSLSYLKRLPVATLKIDQSFVRDMLEDSDDLAILEGIISLAGAFKRDVIAEGVETIEHGKYLLKLGCNLAQGYAIARPMRASMFLDWRNQWLRESQIFSEL